MPAEKKKLQRGGGGGGKKPVSENPKKMPWGGEIDPGSTRGEAQGSQEKRGGSTKKRKKQIFY